jgi:AraC family transcriptional regulator, transcriptional activator of pobA
MNAAKTGTKQGPIYHTLLDQYTALNLPTELMGRDPDFTIFDLKDLNRTFPFASPVSRLNFFVFVFVKDAVGEYLVDDKYYAIEPGTVYFTNPGHWRSFNWLGVNSVCLITMSESFLKENIHNRVFEEFPFLLSETFPGKKITQELFSEFEELYLQVKKAHLSSSAYRRRIMGSLFVVILLKIKEIFWQQYDALAEGDRNSMIVRDFKILIEQHYNNLALGTVKRAFGVQDYAAALQLHPNYLNSVIKSKTGQPLSAWLAGKNIIEAKSLLMNTAISVKEISYRLGFKSTTHFSSYFKRYAGCSPSEYRTYSKKE